jgi:hypothetical protein
MNYTKPNSKSLSISKFLVLLFLILSFFSSCDKLTEIKLAPTITKQPSDAIVSEGQSVSFSVAASGTAPITFQWYKNGETIPGAIDSVYKIASVGVSDNGTNFTVTISNSEGNVTSLPALLTVLPGVPKAIIFTSQGASFAPVIKVDAGATILWTWADQTTSNSASPTKNYGSNGTRPNKLLVIPWSALKSINIGYDAGDGGTHDIDMVPNQNVSMVEGLENVAPNLETWCSSYNQIQSLDFNNFINLQTIECFLSQSLQNVNLNNTPKLKRACFEDCNLSSLDLSQSPSLEDLRGAVNNYSSINFGTTGNHTWHICVRDNPQLTDQHIFSNMSHFPEISELFIWNDNQAGELNIPSTSGTMGVSLLGDGNHYTSLNLSGALQNGRSVAEVSFRNNNLSSINIAGCLQICILNLENNRLSSATCDEILATIDGLGRDREATPDSWNLMINLKGNNVPGATGYTHAQNLATKGWTIQTDQWTVEPGPPLETGEARIDFTTNGDATNMRCDFSGSPACTWHWSDGSTSTGISGGNVNKTGLGAGNHNHYFIISNGAALTRFGAAQGGGNGHLVSISNFTNSPLLRVIYVYNEALLTSLGRTNLTKTREYHLMGTGLSTAVMDQVFEDTVSTNVLNGIIYCANLGTSASDVNRSVLINRGWQLN